MWIAVIKSSCTFAYRWSPGRANAPVLSNKCLTLCCTAIIQNERDYWIQGWCPLGLSLSSCIALYFLSKWISSPQTYYWVIFQSFSPSCTKLAKHLTTRLPFLCYKGHCFFYYYHFLSISHGIWKEQNLKCMGGLFREDRERQRFQLNHA